jgi:integrase
MVNKLDKSAPASNPARGQDPMWDRTPALAADEQAAFAALSSWYKNGSRGRWPLAISKNLRRLTQPVCDELDWMHVASVPRNSSLRVMMMEMIQRRTSFWDWSDQDWIDVLKPSEGAFKLRNGCHGNCRQYVMALAYRLGRFDRLEEIGTFFQYRLAIKVFGREPVDVAASQVRHEMTALGFSEGGKRGLSQALHMALLYQRSARLEDIKIETLHRVLNSGPEHVRVGSAMLSRTLERMGIVEKGFCNRQDNRRRPANEYSAVEGVPPIWLDWCNRWRAMSTRAETSTTSTYYGILKCGRWLADVHPEILSPAQWNRGLALEYASVSARMAVGQWANPVGVARNRLGKPLKPSAVASHLRCIRDFFNDLHSWEWVPQKFSPAQTLRPSRTILARIGPDPRVIADDIWAKLIWAGINLTDGDLHQSAGQIRQPPSYPLSMVRASALLWLFGGLRRDEIHRMPVGCIRWSDDNFGSSDQSTCLLDVPTSKTSSAFTKPIDPIAGTAIEDWEKIRPPHPAMLDRKTGKVVDYLFVYKGRRVAANYINRGLIPLLCKKAGVPEEDARGRVTSHRARATIATQLFNAKNPLSLFELQAWLGHASPQATQHYAAITPTKLANSFRAAGYFERNVRTIEVLIDKEAMRSRGASPDQPIQYFDLGHGYCNYDFFDQCPHRMACAKCSFYEPKGSTRMQALETSGNLKRMLQEITLTDTEKAAIEEGAELMDRLIAELDDTPTPDDVLPSKTEEL